MCKMHFLQICDASVGTVSGMLILRPEDAQQGTTRCPASSDVSYRTFRPRTEEASALFIKVIQCDRRHGQQRCSK
ncbi:hypothetical protein Pat9b_4846 (plasmid) [Pantoea sp. At-9b]|nr:hypothetical protein Pat9b_4846 [Pantoea sp. At-9b]